MQILGKFCADVRVGIKRHMTDGPVKKTLSVN